MKALTIAAKELRDIARERTVLAAVAVQLMVALFSAVLVVGLAALLDPSGIPVAPTAPVAYSGDGGLEPYLADAGLRVQRVADLEAGRALERAGRAAAAIHEDVTPDGANVTLVVAEGSLDAVVLVPRLREVLQEYEDDLRRGHGARLAGTVPVLPPAPRSGIAAPVATTLVPILVLTPAFLAGAIIGDSWTREAQTRTMALLRTSPVRAWHIVAGKMAVPLALAPLQAALWLGLLALGGARIQQPVLVLGVCLLVACFLGGLGIAVASTAGRTVASQGSYAAAVLLAAMASLLLPRDLLNLLALLASGAWTPDMAATVALLAAAALAALAVGVLAAGRALRRDPLP